MAMSLTRVCQHCGAPWQCDVTGACRFCRVVAPPPGVPVGVAGTRPVLDADTLTRLLLAMTADPSHPLDRLATSLRGVAGDRVMATGTPVSHIDVTLDDWRYRAWVDHDDVSALAVHTVRGVVLKHQPLPFDEWVACVAGHLCEYAATHRHVYDAILALDRSLPS
jgi:hypothetical protein